MSDNSNPYHKLFLNLAIEKEKERLYRSEQYQKNKENAKSYRTQPRVKKVAKKWYEDNKEEISVKKKTYYQLNKERILKQRADVKAGLIQPRWKRPMKRNIKTVTTPSGLKIDYLGKRVKTEPEVIELLKELIEAKKDSKSSK